MQGKAHLARIREILDLLSELLKNVSDDEPKIKELIYKIVDLL